MANVTSTGGFSAPAVTSPTATATVKTPSASASAGAGAPPAPTTTKPTFKDDLATATEKLQPVPHHGRTKIIGGERDGRYVNTSGNKRDGETFTMEYHGGRRWHVYGEGADRVVIPFAKPAARAEGSGAASSGGSGVPPTSGTGKSPTPPSA